MMECGNSKPRADGEAPQVRGPAVEPLEVLEALAIAKGRLPKRTSPSQEDRLGMEGKDCPCAPR